METNFSPKKKRRKKKKENIFKSIFKGLIPWKGDSVTEIFRKVIFLMALVILVVAVIIIANNLMVYLGAENTDNVDGTGGGSAVNTYIIGLKNQEPTEQQIEQLPEGTINEEYAALYEANNDFIGWINIPGTNIDYPVVQGEDNEYYLHKDFDGSDLFEGTIFTDYEGKFGVGIMPNNTILYGHNMLYKYKFTALTNYSKNIDFFKMSPVVDFNTLYQDNKYKIFAVFKVNTEEEHGEVFDYTNYVYFKNSSEFYDFVLECMDRSIYETGIDIEYGDEFLTMSTCDESTGISNMRLVVVARKVRENESPDVDTSKIIRKKTENIKYFDAYYDIYGNTWCGRTWDTSLVKGLDEYIEQNGLENDPA